MMLEEQDVLEVAGRYLPDGAEVLPTVELDIPAYVRFIDMDDDGNMKVAVAYRCQGGTDHPLYWYYLAEAH
ncbi:hypothetical protein EEL30_03250 [Brevibacillus laterosporus]|uniref:Uncharacterized protein n=1 Tax=Brevibacillus laterosporus TaxID=1465 RepID=A0A518V3B9_BRELA|nr:hypothetical protein EEL30_03250 [Brevibacillus laterosporus]